MDVKCDCCNKKKPANDYADLHQSWIEFWGMICSDCRNTDKEENK